MNTDAPQRAEGTSKAVVARSAIWRILEVSGAELLSFLIIVVLARLLMPEEYGLVAIATVILMAGQMLVYHGFAEAIIQRKNLEPAHLNSAFWANISFSIVLALVMVAIAHPIALMTGKPDFPPILVCLAPTMISFGIVGIYQATLRRDMAFKGLAMRSIVATSAGGIAGTIGALSGWGAWALVAQQITYAVANVAVVLWFSKWHPTLSVSLSHLREMFLFGWRIACTWFLELLARNGTILILGIFLDAAMVGLFFVANRVFLALSNLTFWSVGEISLPVLSRLQGERQREINAAVDTLSMTTLVCLASFWGLAAVAEPLVGVLFGSKWIGSTVPLQILASVGILNAITSTTSQILVSFGHPQISLRIQGLISSLQALFVLFAAPFGLIPAALGIAAAFVIGTPYALLQLHRLVGVEIGKLLISQFPVWLAATVMVLAVVLLDKTLLYGQADIVRLLVGVLVGALTFTALLWQLTPSLLKTVIDAFKSVGKRAERRETH